jgi:hypothetical protein
LIANCPKHELAPANGNGRIVRIDFTIELNESGAKRGWISIVEQIEAFIDFVHAGIRCRIRPAIKRGGNSASVSPARPRAVK